jgi:hypothetical protein
VNSDGFGGHIVRISEQDFKLLAQMLDAHYSYVNSDSAPGLMNAGSN